MLSDEVVAFFESKGYQIPSLGYACVLQGGFKGEPGLWQCTLFDPVKRFHVHEQGYSAVEAVSKMVMRLGGHVADRGGRTPTLESLDVALSGLALAMSKNSNDR